MNWHTHMWAMNSSVEFSVSVQIIPDWVILRNKAQCGLYLAEITRVITSFEGFLPKQECFILAAGVNFQNGSKLNLWRMNSAVIQLLVWIRTMAFKKHTVLLIQG